MAFKPVTENNRTPSGDFEPRNYPVPRSGSRKARVSLIVDLGIQNRDPIYKLDDKIVDADTDGAIEVAQKPAHQVAVFADLVADVVDYGGEIGKAPYRLMLNKSFKGVIQGINFGKVAPKDAKGNTLQGKPWTLHPQNLLTKLAKATGRTDVIESADIEGLLDAPFMAQVEVKVTEDKNGKKDADGNVIEYKNVNYKGAAEVPEDDDGNPLAIAALPVKARCVTFDNATVDDIKYLRGNLIKMIKTANNYAGSQMEKAIKAYEAKQAESAGGDDDGEGEQPAEKQAPKKSTAKSSAPKKPTAPDTSDFDDDIPF